MGERSKKPESDHREKCEDLAKRMSTSAQSYAANGDQRRYENTHADINAVLDMRDQNS